MPIRKKASRRATRPRGANYLVVRGKGNAVFVARVKKEFRDTKLAKAIDGFTATGASGAAKSPRAFIVDMDVLKDLDHSTELVFRPATR